ncbi:MAG: hypothetical protein QXG65_06405 [Thermoplasmata archaeon]
MAEGYPNRALPLGVAILAVLTGIFGAFVLLAGLLVTFSSLAIVASMGWTAGFGAGIVAGLVTLLLGLVFLAVAVGLWNQELWAFVLALLAIGAAVLWYVVRPLAEGRGIGSIDLLPSVVSIVLLVYLLAVRDHFA